MSAITLFNFEGSQVRVLMDDKGEPWFVAKDICDVLGYSNPWDATGKHVDPEDLAKREALTSGGMQAVSTINESGLYSLIFGSKLEGAKRFKRWVTSEVLPSIRKTGSYTHATTTTVPVLSKDAEYRATILEASAFLQKMVPGIRPEMMAACTLRALTSCGLLPKASHEDLRNALSVEWDKAPSLTPTEIGQKLGGVKPTLVNKMLESRGLQKKSGKKWEPTEEGKEYAGAVSYQAEHSEYKGVQLKWAPEIVELLQEPLDENKNSKNKLLV